MSAGWQVLIDAKNERAAKWYASYRAVPLADAPFVACVVTRDSPSRTRIGRETLRRALREDSPEGRKPTQTRQSAWCERRVGATGDGHFLTT